MPTPFTSRDKLFFWFASVLTVMMLLTGLSAVMIVLLGSGTEDKVIGLRLVNVFAAMFTGLLGLGSGYLLGANRNGNNH